MYSTHAHYQGMLNASKFNSKNKVSFPQKQSGSVRAIHTSVSLVFDECMEDVIRNTFLANFPGGSLVQSVIKKGTIV